MTHRESTFDALSKLMLLAQGCLAGWFALGGTVGIRELGLVLSCIGLNELRVRLQLERSPIFMAFFWAGLFVAAPVLYLSGGSSFAELSALTKLEGQGLCMLVVALAFPFQSFASYLSSMPRASHLVHAFVLVEVLLGIQEGAPKPAWPYVISLLSLMVVSLMLAEVRVAALDQRQRAERSLRTDFERSLAKLDRQSAVDAVMRTGFALALMLPVVGAALLSFVLYLALPRFDSSDLMSMWRSEQPDKQGEEEGDDPNDRDFSPLHTRVVPQSSSEAAMRERAQRISGLTDEVSLGEYGEVLEDNSVLGTASIEASNAFADRDLLPSSPYLRAQAYESFDGKRWQQVYSSSQHFSVAGEQPFTELWDPPMPSQARRVSTRVQWLGISDGSQPDPIHDTHLRRSVLEEDLRRYVFAPGALERVELVIGANQYSVPSILMTKGHGSATTITLDSEAAVTTGVGAVVATSRLLPTAETEVRRRGNAELPSLRHKKLTELPFEIQQALYREWPERAELGQYGDQPLAMAMAIERWIKWQGGFRYSLSERPQGPDPLISMITQREQRVGHCEYFASLMVCALRSWGIPARLVGGFHLSMRAQERVEGQPSNTWLIRSSDAHAWVEAWLPSRGWTRFDPTPPSRNSNVNQADAEQALEERGFDLLSGRYGTPEDSTAPVPGAADQSDAGDQQDGLDANTPDLARGRNDSALTAGVPASSPLMREELYGRAYEIWADTGEWVEGGMNQLGGIGGVLLALGLIASCGLLWLIVRWMKQREQVRRAERRRTIVQREAESLYSEVQAVLAQLGYKRQSWQTPMEFAEDVVKQSEGRLTPALKATEVYYQLRYRLGATNDDLRGATNEIAALRVAINALQQSVPPKVKPSKPPRRV